MPKRTAIFVCLLAVLCAPGALAADVFTVRHVSDGDTLVLDDGQKVRLIGVDTPEMHDAKRNRDDARRNKLTEKTVTEFAQKAKRFAKEAVEGRSVRLEYDWERQDKYGRTLAYVFREPDGYFLNAEIIREGYGFAYLAFPFKRSQEFRLLAGEAKHNGKGLWKT